MPKLRLPLHQFARLLGGEVRGNEILCPGPQHSPEDRSLAVKMNYGDDFVVHSFSGDDPIVCKDHVRKKLGLAPFTPKSKSNGKDRKAIAATSDYLDEAGNLLFQVVRFSSKTFRQRRPDGDGGWDSRAKSYIESYGDQCWEADVLPAEVIEDAINTDIMSWLNRKLWKQREAEIERARKLL